MANRKTAKAKGKRLEKTIEERVKNYTGLCEDHVRSAIGSENGEDIILSKKAKELFPYAVECKSRKAMSLYRYYEQASKNAGGLEPLVIVKADRKKPLVIFDLNHFFELIEN